MLQLTTSGDFVHQTPCRRGFAPGLHRGTSVPQTSYFRLPANPTLQDGDNGHTSLISIRSDVWPILNNDIFRWS